MNPSVSRALERMALLLEEQVQRLEGLGGQVEAVDFSKVKPLVVGVIPGDGIGPGIAREATRVLRRILQAEILEGKVELRTIDGLTIENRLRHGTAIPPSVLEAVRECHVVLKGPTTTPDRGGSLPDLESANVAMRRELDLFVNVRPVRVPSRDLDWTFFRENTEGPYPLGSRGIQVTPELAVDLSVATAHGSRRVIRMAFEHARARGIGCVTGVAMPNVIKATDGLFMQIGEEVAAEFPGIRWEAWHADIAAARMADPAKATGTCVFVLPNLYGDILTEEAAVLQGGVGTVGSANIGLRHAVFEPIHGSATRMVQEGRAEYANPSSLLRAAAMMIRHVGMRARADMLDMALDIVNHFDRQVVVTGRPGGATTRDFTDHLLNTLESNEIAGRWAVLREHARRIARKRQKICDGEMDAFGNLRST
ncbi:isocitrate/isopropylmalate dehydrogenase family protein [Myxococcota bacterium]|nr:isocitrate/isopropylmalate dehydrogenase family protein [Myxococcota bacterium]